MIIYKQFRLGHFVSGLFLAVMLCSSCDEDNTKVPNDAIIVLEVFDENNMRVTELAGDGQTLLKLQAKIPRDADDKYRKVIFRTSKGQFMSTTSQGTYEKNVNADGLAEVYLKVPLDHGALFLSAEIGSDSDKYFSEKNITLTDVGQIIYLEIQDQNGNPVSSEIKADGNTILTVKATVKFNGDTIKSIKFLASDGKFLTLNGDSNIVTTNNNVATIQYKVPKKAGEIYLRVEASDNANIYQNSNVLLARAFADHIILEPSTLSIDSPDDLVTVNTLLKRDNGYVSIGTPAHYQAFQSNSNGNEIIVGRFTGLAEANTNENDQITVKFIPDTGNIDFEQPIMIKVTTRNDNNVELSQSFILKKLVKP